eukprot:s1110_g1.t1
MRTMGDIDDDLGGVGMRLAALVLAMWEEQNDLRWEMQNLQTDLLPESMLRLLVTPKAIEQELWMPGLPGQVHQDASNRQPGLRPADPLQAADPWSRYQPSTPTNAVPAQANGMPAQSAQDFVNGLRTGVQDARVRPVASAFEFEALGKTVPASPTSDSSPNPSSSSTENWFKKLVEALSGDKRASVPPWSGAPSGLRSWLKQLGMWEQETTTPKSRWGIKLYSALPMCFLQKL